MLQLLSLAVLFATGAPWCGDAKITGYVRTEFSSHTYDGTSIYTDEPIVAASWDVAMSSSVDIAGLGTFRVADRGQLGYGNPTWIDIAVWTRSEAYDRTGMRWVCISRPSLE